MNKEERELLGMKDKKKKRKFKTRWYTKIIFLLDIFVVVVMFVINTTAFKTFWIPTAMTTMSHKYLAYMLYSSDVINKIMSANYIEQNTEEMNLDNITIGGGCNKKTYSSEYEKDLCTKEKGNDVFKIISINEPSFKGYLTVIYDPADVELAVSSKLGIVGESVNNLVKNNNGLVGINGGGFEDLDGWGNGSIPYGAIIQDGQLVWTHPGGSGQLIGFTKDHKMWLTDLDPNTAISQGMWDAVEFGPNLIVNGNVSKIHGDGGWGTAPRTVIAQRQDGIVLFLVIDGRLPGYSIGATMNDVIEVLLRYDAYNAANLDGGASTTMSLGGFLYNYPSAGGEYGGRTVSNAFIVTNLNNKAAKLPENNSKYSKVVSKQSAGGKKTSSNSSSTNKSSQQSSNNEITVNSGKSNGSSSSSSNSSSSSSSSSSGSSSNNNSSSGNSSGGNSGGSQTTDNTSGNDSSTGGNGNSSGSDSTGGGTSNDPVTPSGDGGNSSGDGGSTGSDSTGGETPNDPVVPSDGGNSSGGGDSTTADGEH